MSDDPSKLGPGEEWHATPEATAAADAAGVDMAPIQGSGEGGEVTAADVQAHVDAAAESDAAAELSAVQTELAFVTVHNLPQATAALQARLDELTKGDQP